AGPPAAAAVPARPPRAIPRAEPRHDSRNDPAPWRRYAVAAPARAGRAAVAIVIDDLGLDRPRTARTIALPGPLTLSFLPYAGELAHQTEAGRRAGHELMLHLPMEAESRRISPGPNALRVGLEPTELLDLLAWNLGRFDGYVGVNNHMGSRFTADAGAMRTVLAELERRGLMFLDSRTSSHSVGYRLGAELGLPVAQRDIFLDNVLTADRVADQLAEVERVAKRHGHAVAIGHPHDATLEALTEWLPHLEARGLVLVPITALARAPQQAQARW
ncbi:divergent polysaccharide deacetylase family protein, partial [Desertibaculum subflavum]|uniref:divergent polysaccharide deacetylase family protein n=1 Tax=Desertibaculum subflavum TaxID=2268458 RepID=UPI0034D1C01F